jgi:hypothetical protein
LHGRGVRVRTRFREEISGDLPGRFAMFVLVSLTEMTGGTFLSAKQRKGEDADSEREGKWAVGRFSGQAG